MESAYESASEKPVFQVSQNPVGPSGLGSNCEVCSSRYGTNAICTCEKITTKSSRWYEWRNRKIVCYLVSAFVLAGVIAVICYFVVGRRQTTANTVVMNTVATNTTITSTTAFGNIVDVGTPVTVQLNTLAEQRGIGDYIFSNTAAEWTSTPIQTFQNNAQATASYTFTFPGNGTYYIMYISPIDWNIHATLQVQVGPTTKITSVSGSNYLPVGMSSFLVTTAPADRGNGGYVLSNTQPSLTETALEKYQFNGNIAAIYNFTFSTQGIYYIVYASTDGSQVYYTLKVKVTSNPANPRTSMNALQLAAISYWPASSTDFDKLPPGTVALLNPNNGIFDSPTSFNLISDIANYQAVVQRTIARGVKIIGYIPTGNGNHTAACYVAAICQGWDRIEAQLKAYATQFPTLSGIWFDEAAFPTPLDTYSNIVQDYSSLRTRFQTLFAATRKEANPLLVFNPGSPFIHYFEAALAGEIVIIFENSQAAFLSQQFPVGQAQAVASANNALTWAIINTCPNTTDALSEVLNLVNKQNIDLVYVTNIGADWRNGDNTYGALPSFWENETDLVAKMAL